LAASRRSRFDAVIPDACCEAPNATKRVRIATDFDASPGSVHRDELNIRRVGEALGNLFEIRNEIYEERPDLMPEFLKGKW
jgi:hypothetical protein